MNDTSLVQTANTLRSVPFFADMDPERLDRVMQSTRRVTFKAGDVVVREGDPSDALFVVDSGCLSVHLAGKRDPHIDLLRRGALVGEIGVLARRPRSATVIAQVDSTLLFVDSSTLFAMMHDSAKMSVHMVQYLASRLSESQPRPQPSNRPRTRISVVGSFAQPGAALQVFEAVTAELQAIGRDAHIVILDDIPETEWDDRAFGPDDQHLAIVLSENSDRAAWWADAHADRVIIVSDGTQDPPTENDIERLGGPGAADLVCVSHVDVDSWEQVLDPPMISHVSATSPGGSIMRLARRLAGESLSLVLSGGGAWTFAHIGVVAEILDRGYTIDRVGGSGLGAFVGARFAMGETPTEVTAFFRELVEQGAFDQFAADGGAGLSSHFETRDIATLPVDFFVLSANPGGGVTLRRSGDLRAACLDSVTSVGSAPIYYQDQGQSLASGSLLDTSPVSQLLDQRDGPVFGSDVVGRDIRRKRWTAGQISDDPALQPDPADVAFKAMDMDNMASVAYGRHGTRNLLFRPAVQGDMTDFSRLDEHIEAGRAHVRDLLATLA